MPRRVATTAGPLLDSFSEVVESIYAAALQPSLWPKALDRIGWLHGCPAVHLLTPAAGTTDDGGFHGVPEGRVFLSGEASGAIDLEATLFYLDYLRRVGVGSGGYCAGVVFDGSQRDLAATSCALFHGNDGRAFTDEDRKLHALTIRHLSRALGTMYRLRDAEMRVAASLAALEALAASVVLLGERGQVLFANRSALQVLAFADGLRLRAGGARDGDTGWLTASRAEDQQHLEAGIRDACAAPVAPRTHFSTGIAIRRTSGRRPLLVQLAPLAAGNSFLIGAQAPAAITFIVEPDRAPALDSSLLTRVFGFTGAECALARQLAGGEGLQAAARELGIAVSTAKTQLKGLFDKTGTRRQAELTRVLMATASPLNGAVFGSPSPRDEDERRAAMLHGRESMISMMVVRDEARPAPKRLRAPVNEFPSRPITITVGFAPGGATDIFTRIVAKNLADRLGQPVVVENRAGSSGSAGWAYLAQASADGYTLHVAGVEGLAVSSITRRDLPYKPLSQFAAVIMGAVSPIVFVVPASLPFTKLDDLLAEARARPGEVTYASPGATTSNHLAGALLAARANVKLLHVPYKGGGPAMVDLLGGRLTMYPAQVPTSKAHIEAGRLRALATASIKRIALMPSVPNVAECGLVGAEVESTYSLFAPRGTPEDRLDTLNAEIDHVLRDPHVRAQLDALGLEAVGGTRQRLEGYLAGQVDRWQQLLGSGALRLD